jgi:hypothetical protein
VIVDMIPGPHPLEELEAALLRVAVNPPPSLIEQLERDELGLIRAVKRVVAGDDIELLLFIDQLEEMFTLVDDEDARTHLLAGIHAAVGDPRGQLRVVTTLRADFYDRPLLYRGFADLMRSRVEAVVPLSPEELEEAIVHPAKAVGAGLEPGLLAELLAEVSSEPGALPLLQYALTELFDRREGNTLTLAAHREIGGVAGALAGEDHDVGVEKLDIAHKLADRSILHDGVRAVLDVSVGENIDPLRLKRVPIAHGFRGGPFDQALVGDIGVGPLIDANETRACRARNRQRVKRGVGQHVNPDRQPGCGPNAIGRDRHMRRGFRADVLRFRKWNVAVVLDNEAVKAGVSVSSRVRQRSRIDRLDPTA